MGANHFGVALMGALGALLLAAGIEDARRRTIGNGTNLAIALLAPAWWWAQGLAPWPDVAAQLALALAVFAVFAGAFALGLMGGGDVKLIAAVALWLPVRSLGQAFVWMALIGGVLTVAMIADEWIRRRAARPRPSPVVAAVAAATALVLVVRPTQVAWLQAHPLLAMTLVEAALVAAGALLVAGARAARRRGITPETPYGVAIAAAALLALREPILNQLA